MADYNDGGMYPANGSGAFVVVMPGVIRADYSIDVNYIGRFINLDDASYVVAEVELGEDVANAKLHL